MSMNKKKIGVLLGSVRPNGNSHGIQKWVDAITKRSVEDDHDIFNIYPDGDMHPLGPVIDDIIPALIKSDEFYQNGNVRSWSKLVRTCDAFIIISPQYNWGYPGDLKNALDHLYNEWHGKPVLIITYGGHGGEKCNLQLKQVCSGLKMRVVDDSLCITLPGDYIRGDVRVSADDSVEVPQFLRDHDEALIVAIRHLLAAVHSS